MIDRFKRRTWEILESAKPGDFASRAFDIFILGLIYLNVVAVILGSVAFFRNRYDKALNVFEAFSVAVFTIEYCTRMWSCSTDASFSGIKGKLRFMFQPMSVIDLLAVLPFYLPVMGVDLRTLRAVRLVRVLRLAKAGRYYSSLRLIRNVLVNKKEDLVLTSGIMAFLLIMSSCLLYYCENSVQPESFSSIPATMWWAVATLTTVGYGDMYPMTFLGKLCGSIVSILGIGMFALPTGILGAGFLEEMQRVCHRKRICPHCGKEID